MRKMSSPRINDKMIDPPNKAEWVMEENDADELSIFRCKMRKTEKVKLAMEMKYSIRRIDNNEIESSSEKKCAKTGGSAVIPAKRKISAKKRINDCLNADFISKLMSKRCVY